MRIKYDCLECGYQHNRPICPRCGGSDKIDHIDDQSSEEQSAWAIAEARRKDLAEIAYLASRQPKCSGDAVPANAKEVVVEKNSYTIKTFYISPEIIIYIELTNGYSTITRIDDTNLAARIRAI